MDIDRIQKINTLALDLVKKGLAATQDEAIAQAEQIFRVREDDVTFTRPQMQNNSLQVDSSSLNSGTPSQEDSSAQTSLSQDKIKDILEKNTQFLVSKIRDFTAKLDQLHSELASVKRELAQRPAAIAPSAPKVEPLKDAVPAPSAAPPSPAQRVSQAPAPPQENHPRSGVFGDTDVSIEKFFYAGNK